jgi:hypothetical protein
MSAALSRRFRVGVPEMLGFSQCVIDPTRPHEERVGKTIHIPHRFR